MADIEMKNCINRDNNVINKEGCLSIKNRKICKKSYYKDKDKDFIMACRVHNRPSKRACHFKSRKMKGNKIAVCNPKQLPKDVSDPRAIEERVNELLTNAEAEILSDRHFTRDVNKRLEKLKGTTQKSISNMTMTEKEFNDDITKRIAALRNNKTINKTNRSSGGKKKTKRNKKYKKRTRKY